MVGQLARLSAWSSVLVCCLACASNPVHTPYVPGSVSVAAGNRAGATANPISDAAQRLDASVPAELPQVADARVAAADASLVTMDAAREGGALLDAGAPRSPDAASAMVDAAQLPSSRSLVCPAVAAYSSPLPSNTQATLIKGGFGFLEGPVWVAAQGTLLFSDLDFATSNDPLGPSVKLRRFRPPQTFDVLVVNSGSNGLALANDGRVLAASHDVQSLSLFDPATGQREVLDVRYQGKHFNSPNDVAVRADGTVYFTDPDWQLGTRSSETGIRGVYRVEPNGNVSLIDGSLDQPNGVALSPDERTLYVGSHANDVVAYALAPDGSAGTRTRFASTGLSDGLSVDCAGNLYVSAATVQVFDPRGHKLGDIQVAEDPKNVAFGGPKQTTLYITAGAGLYAIELNVPGRCY